MKVIDIRTKIRSRLAASVVVLLAIVGIGAVGYVGIEGYTVTESLYMTIITVSTVGFGEIRPLSNAGMMFTSALIVSSIGTFAYAASSVTHYFVDGDYRRAFQKQRHERILAKMENHVIICGFGRVGDQAAEELKSHDTPVVVIESDPEKVQALRAAGWEAIEGDATDDENLRRAGIGRAKALLTTLPDDAGNVYVVLAAKEQNPDLLIISRASNGTAVHKLRVAGARNVIMPDRVGGAHMATLVAMPDVVEFMDHIRIQGAGDVNLEEVAVGDLPGNVRLTMDGVFDAARRMGVNVIGLKRSTGEFVINPGAETHLDAACKLFVLGNADQIRRLHTFLRQP